ncbi:hypothetical protein HC723_11065 [Vibrio sp. S11_S32]|uniref:hypothetical protein n=1 Tax=Vibrio sp. S11_S32 TaxID=2720225 RepID=UPI001680DBE5|nr:hypothetical protein [Vibrio sp. S11_S32]MBD1576969.1 hypothetical protein [Vibrio sp. S11_S32]
MNIIECRQSLLTNKPNHNNLSCGNENQIKNKIAHLTTFFKNKTERMNETIIQLKQEDIYHQVKSLMLKPKEDHYPFYGLMGIYRLATLLSADTSYSWSVCLLNYGVVIFSDFKEITMCAFFAENKNGEYYPAEFNYNKHPMEFGAKKYIDNYYFKMYKEKYESQHEESLK